MKASALLLVVLLGGLLIYCSFDFPSWGDPGSPASLHVSPYYIEHGEADTHAPNLGTIIWRPVKKRKPGSRIKR